MAKTILCVDDSASIRQMVGFTLKHAGFNVVEAVDGMDGLAKASAGGIDLVLTDQNMPKMDGITFLKKLRATPKGTKVPVLLLTTEAGDRLKSEGRMAGATGWLVKPFDPKRLVEVVTKLA